jgi:hypothetical protein
MRYNPASRRFRRLKIPGGADYRPDALECGGDDLRALREALEMRAFREAFDATIPDETRDTCKSPDVFHLAVFHAGMSTAISSLPFGSCNGMKDIR